MNSVNYNDQLYTTICSEKTIQSETKGFFLDFADNVIHFAGLDWLNNTFGKLKNDRARIKALLADDQVCTKIFYYKISLCYDLLLFLAQWLDSDAIF